MPIGEVVPTPGGAGAPVVFGSGPVPAGEQAGVQPASSSAPTWFRRQLPTRSLVVPELGVPVPVAMLEAPGTGLEYVLERITLGTGGSVGDPRGVLLAIGGLSLGNVIDFTPPDESGLVTQSDPNPWRLGAGDALYFVWPNPNPAATDRIAIVQVRTERG